MAWGFVSHHLIKYLKTPQYLGDASGFGKCPMAWGFVSHHLIKYLLKAISPILLGDVPIGHSLTPAQIQLVMEAEWHQDTVQQGQDAKPTTPSRNEPHINVGIAIINHPFLMVYTTHLW